MLRHRSRPRPAPADDLLAAWIARAGTPDPGLREAGGDLVDAALDLPRPPRGALRRFGRHLGAAGWPLADVSGWVDALADLLDGPRAATLRDFDAGTALADGWAEGFLRGAGSDGAIDPLTGLVTPAVLRVRLGELHARCRALGVDPGQAFVVVVVDAHVRDLPLLLRDSALVLLAGTVCGQFSRGETVAASGDRVLVVAARTPALLDEVRRLDAQLSAHALLADARVQAWVEPLPRDAAHLDPFVLDLAA